MVRHLRQIVELERLAGSGLPRWSPELTEQTDPVLAEIERMIDGDRAVRDEVLDHLDHGENEAVAEWLRLCFRPDLSLTQDERERSVRCAGLSIPSRAAAFLASDTITVPDKKLRRLGRPWERAAGWFFGSPQESPALDSWPVRPDGTALDFMLQIDLAEVARSMGGLEEIGLPEDVTLQLFADLRTSVGPVAHRVVAFESGEGGSRVMRPPRGSDVNDAHPILVNPVGALTLRRPDDPLHDLDPRDARAYDVVHSYAHEAPYEMNLFRRTDSAEEGLRDLGWRHVPMARLGGHPVAEPEAWQQITEALGRDATELFLLYDGPVDPESAPIPDPERSRLMVVIERSSLERQEFSATIAFGY